VSVNHCEDGVRSCVPDTLAALRAGKFDLVVVNRKLDRDYTDGLDIIKHVKADPALASIPVIAVTSYALSGDEAKTRAAGCDGYIAKPYSPRQMLAKVREILGD